MISAEGKPKQILKYKERKSLTTDRVILVPGPRHEIACVRRMFSLAADGQGASAISRALNERGRTANNKPWSARTVSLILRNPKYAGWNVWHRHTQRLRPDHRKPVKPQDWIMGPRAFAPIVDQKTFDAAQTALPTRADALWSDAELLKKLRRLLTRKGRLSETLVLETRGMPGTTTLKARFGSTRKAFEAAGFHVGDVDLPTTEKFERSRRLRRKLVADLKNTFPNNVVVTHLPNKTRSVLRIDDTFMVSILLCAYRRRYGRIYWKVEPNAVEREFITLVCPINTDNKMTPPYYVFSQRDGIKRHDTYTGDPWLRTGIRLTSLSQFYEVVTRMWSLSSLRYKSPYPSLQKNDLLCSRLSDLR
jgi:hypothetical protein